ncbi:MAG TPA: prolipoprotein diacylglyceryl transferase family protein [Niastella sp.]
MYPDFQYVFEALTGHTMPSWLGLIKTFGFFVAIAFIAATYFITSEVKRQEQIGSLMPSVKRKTIGYLRYKHVKKQQVSEPQIKAVIIYPHQRINEIVMISVVSGLIGAKIFNALETWQDFIQHPIASIFSTSGLTFYGGLITAFVTIYFYSKKHGISFKNLCDAAAPALMLAYGIGRLGCHFAGDGDWGIFNSAYITAPNGKLLLASPQEYQNSLATASDYLKINFGSPSNVPHIFLPAPSWLPDWMVAMNYPHNVINEGIPINDCAGQYCSVLPIGVFPTPLYESITCILLFSLLWLLRKRFKYPLQLFSITSY